MSDQVQAVRHAVKPLHSLLVSKIARDLVDKLEPQIFKSFDVLPLQPDAFSFVQAVVDDLVDRGVPSELLKALQVETSKYSNYVSFILAFFLGDRTECLIAVGEGEDKMLTFPPSHLEFLITNVSCGFDTIDFSALRVEDSFLRALVSSRAAQSLHTLIAEFNEFTDQVAPLWPQLLALEELNLNHGKLLTERSLVEIAKSSTLSVLKLNQLERCSLREIAPIALQEHALPNLSHLEMFNDFEDVHTASRTQQERRTLRVIDLLERRPNRERLNYLYAKFIDDPEITMKIHTLCPSLTALVISDVPLNLILDSRDSMSRLQEADISFDDRDLVTEDFEQLALACPQLTALTLSSVLMGPDCRLDMLTNLKKLSCYSMQHALTMAHWPPNLHKLALKYIDLAPPPEGSSNQDLVDKFVNTICSSVLNLEEFEFQIEDVSMTHKHLLQLLGSLRHLKVLVSPTNDEISASNDDEALVYLNSPSLQLIRPSWGFGNTLLACGRLPALKRIEIQHPARDESRLLARFLESISPASTPSLAEVRYNGRVGASSDSGPAQFDLVLDSLIRMRNTIEQLDFSAALRLEQTQRLCSLAKLTSLELFLVDMSDELCARLLKSLNHLITLRLHSCEGIRTLNWLRHSLLANLTLAGLTLDARVVLTGSDLPNLKDLSSFHVSTDSMTVKGLARLGWVSIISMGIGSSLHISDCKLLHRLSLEQLYLHEFEIFDVPNMTTLVATSCQFSRASTFRAELPGLSNVELESNTCEKSFITKWADELEAEARDGLKRCVVSFEEDSDGGEEDFYDNFDTNFDEEEIDE